MLTASHNESRTTHDAKVKLPPRNHDHLELEDEMAREGDLNIVVKSHTENPEPAETSTSEKTLVLNKAKESMEGVTVRGLTCDQVLLEYARSVHSVTAGDCNTPVMEGNEVRDGCDVVANDGSEKADASGTGKSIMTVPSYWTGDDCHKIGKSYRHYHKTYINIPPPPTPHTHTQL